MLIGLRTFLVRAYYNAVEIFRKAEHIKLVFRKLSLSVREQVYFFTFFFKRVEQVDYSVVELNVLSRVTAERRADKVDFLSRSLYALSGK